MNKWYLIIGLIVCTGLNAVIEDVAALNATLFEVAAGKCKISVTNLCNRGAKVNCENDDGATPLHCAAETMQAELFGILLVAGADPTLTDFWGRTAIERFPSDKRHLSSYVVMKNLLLNRAMRGEAEDL